MKSLRNLAAAAPVIAALLAGAAPAMADTASVTFLDAAGRNDPAAGIGRALVLSVKNGRLIRLGATPRASLAPGAPVSVVLSSGRPCVVPSSPAGLTLRQAKSRLKSAGCTAGAVSRVRSARRKGTVVSFSPRAGKTLASRAVVKIRVSRGRR